MAEARLAIIDGKQYETVETDCRDLLNPDDFDKLQKELTNLSAIKELMSADIVSWRNKAWDAEEQLEQCRGQMSSLVPTTHNDEDARMIADLSTKLARTQITVTNYEAALAKQVCGQS